MCASERQSRSITVSNENGLHLRPASMVATLARKFECQIEIEKDSNKVDAKSELAILTLGATRGTKLVIYASGPDACRALHEVAEMIGSSFPDEAVPRGRG
jgi:phosphotransferase system HPr (HPr) family protein